MRIHQSEVVSEGEVAKLQARFTRADGTGGTLWFSVPVEHGHLLTPERQDAFVIPLLIESMRTGEFLSVDGVTSEKLFHNLTHHYIPILQQLIPSLRRVTIGAEHTSSERVGDSRGVITGFSGGIDSFCVLADHLLGSPVDSYTLTHLAFNNVGSHGKDSRPNRGRPLFEQRFLNVEPVARELGIPMVKIDSNMDDVLGLGFQLTHTPRNVAAILALQRGIGKYIYASGVPYPNCSIQPTYDTAYSDAITLPLLSTETTECMSGGSQYTRVQKTVRVAEVPASYSHLDVCVKARVGTQKNCSACWKCLRTLATLEIAGRVDRYDRVFDLAQWRKNRSAYLKQVRVSNDVLQREIRSFAKERGYPLPSLAAAQIASVPSPLELASKLKKKVLR